MAAIAGCAGGANGGGGGPMRGGGNNKGPARKGGYRANFETTVWIVICEDVEPLDFRFMSRLPRYGRMGDMFTYRQGSEPPAENNIGQSLIIIAWTLNAIVDHIPTITARAPYVEVGTVERSVNPLVVDRIEALFGNGARVRFYILDLEHGLDILVMRYMHFARNHTFMERRNQNWVAAHRQQHNSLAREGGFRANFETTVWIVICEDVEPLSQWFMNGLPRHGRMGDRFTYRQGPEPPAENEIGQSLIIIAWTLNAIVDHIPTITTRAQYVEVGTVERNVNPLAVERIEASFGRGARVRFYILELEDDFDILVMRYMHFARNHTFMERRNPTWVENHRREQDERREQRALAVANQRRNSNNTRNSTRQEGDRRHRNSRSREDDRREGSRYRIPRCPPRH